MKLLHYTNVVFYLTTIIGYLIGEVFIGLTFQFFFGIIQLLYFLICRSRINSEKIKSHLRFYIALVGMIILTLALLFKIMPFENTVTLIVMTFIPMSIATYFVYITYLIQKQ